jgi:hypothetical protein
VCEKERERERELDDCPGYVALANEFNLLGYRCEGFAWKCECEEGERCVQWLRYKLKE